MPQPGKISASMAKAVATQGRGKGNEYGATFIAEAKKVAAGMIGWDVSTDISNLPAVKWGIEHEWEAIQTYEEQHIVQVHSQQEWQQTDCGRMGCTPDGLVGVWGMIEVKCPLPHNHLDNILENAQLSQYADQIQFSLGVTQREWCDFISFHPDAPEGLRLHVHRVERDEERIVYLLNRASHMHSIACEYAEVLKARLS